MQIMEHSNFYKKNVQEELSDMLNNDNNNNSDVIQLYFIAIFPM